MVNGLNHLDDLGCYPKSPGWHNKIWTLSHTDDLANCSISSGLLMDSAGCHPDDFPNLIRRAKCHLNPKSSGWVTTWLYLIRMTHGRCIMSSGWLSWRWYLIRMSYGKFIMSSANFDFHNTLWPFSASERSNYAWDHGVDCKGEKPVISRHSNPKSCIDGNYIYHQWRD